MTNHENHRTLCRSDRGVGYRRVGLLWTGLSRIARSRSGGRRGLTLIELLVVGTIIMILTAVSLPVVKPMLDSQLTKNSAQIVSTYLNRAKNRALLTGRPCGVRFEIWDGTESKLAPMTDNSGSTVYYYTFGASLVMRQVEIPPVYSGLFDNAMVNVGSGGLCLFPNDLYVTQRLADESGAKIQFNGSGPYYSFRKGTKLAGDDLYEPAARNGLSFKILFGPKTTMTAPTALVRGTAVDLQFSGVGTACFAHDKVTDFEADGKPIYQRKDVTILFAPDGSVQSVNGTAPAESIHFLIGRWDQIGAVRLTGDTQSFPNYADGRNFWVSVNPQTGTVVTSQVNPFTVENSGTSTDYYVPFSNDVKPDPYLGGRIARSRELTH